MHVCMHVDIYVYTYMYVRYRTAHNDATLVRVSALVVLHGIYKASGVDTLNEPRLKVKRSWREEILVSANASIISITSDI